MKKLLFLAMAVGLVVAVSGYADQFTGYPDDLQIWTGRTTQRIRDVGSLTFGDSDDVTFAYDTTNDELDITGSVTVSGGVTFAGAQTIGDGTGAVTFDSGTYNTSNSDDNIVNVGDIELDSISPDATAITICNTAADDVTIGNSTGNVTVVSDNADVTLTDATDNVFQLINSGGAVLMDVDLGAADAITLGSGAETVTINSSDWDISATGDITNAGAIGADGDVDLSATGGATGDPDLGVAGYAKFAGTVEFDGAIDADDAMVVDGNVDFASTGGSTGSADFDVAGYSQFAGTVEIDGAIDADSTAVIDGEVDLASTGGSTGSADFDVAGYAQFAGSVEFDGAIDADSTMVVDGEVDLASTGGSSGSADFDVAGYAQFAGTVEIDGAADLDSTLVVDGLTDFASTGGSSGAADFDVAGYAQFDSTGAVGAWGYTGEHVDVPYGSTNTNPGWGQYFQINEEVTTQRVMAGEYTRFLCMTDQPNIVTMVGTESQFRLRDADIAKGVHAGLWAYAEQSGTSVLSGDGTFDGLNATVESEAGFSNESTTQVTGITVDSSINASATIDADSNFSGIYIKSNGKDWYTGVKITGATTDIALQNGETIDNATDGIVNIVGDVQNRGALNYAGVSASTNLNTYVLDATPDLVVTAPTKGQVITWCSDTAGDGASTVSVDGVADTLQDREGNATAASDIVVDGMVIMIFDGTNWRLAGI